MGWGDARAGVERGEKVVGANDTHTQPRVTPRDCWLVLLRSGHLVWCLFLVQTLPTTHTLSQTRTYTHTLSHKHGETQGHSHAHTHTNNLEHAHIYVYTHTHAHLYTNVRLSPGMSRCANIVNALSLGAACLLPSTCEDACLTWYAWQKLNDMIIFFFFLIEAFVVSRWKEILACQWPTCFKEHSLSLPARSGGTSVNCGSPRQWDINDIVVYISESSFHVWTWRVFTGQVYSSKIPTNIVSFLLLTIKFHAHHSQV